MFSTRPGGDSAGWNGLTEQDSLALADRYEVLDEVARGGMGTVFRAATRHSTCKWPSRSPCRTAPTDRFLREAQLLARIRSPHVVVVHDFDILPDGCPCWSWSGSTAPTCSSW